MSRSSLTASSVVVAIALGASGCALLGESEAQRRWRELVDAPVALEPGPEPAAKTPPTEEELAIRNKGGLTVDDCLRLGVIRSERLRAGAERVHQTDLNEVEAVGAVLPTAHYRFQYFRQDPAVISPFSPNETRTHWFVLDQPLFRGFRDYSAVLEIRDQRKAEEARLAADRLEVALDAGRAFYEVVALERVVDTLARSLKLEEERLAEVRAREASGIARRTETLFIETTKARTEADLAQARDNLSAARARLAFFTGAPDAKLVASDKPPPAPAPLDELLARVKDRPDVSALGHEVEARTREVAIAEGELLPNVDAISDLYARREGFLEDVWWDFQIQLDWPLFEGGRSLAHIRRAESRAREAGRTYADARERATTEITAAFHAYRAALASIPALATRVRSAEENVRLLDAEYRAGIATNLEAVEAENARSAAQLDYERQLYDAHRLELELRAAAGDQMLVPPPYTASAPAPAPAPEKR